MSEKARVSGKYAGTRGIPGKKGGPHTLARPRSELSTNNRASASCVALRRQHQRAGKALRSNAPIVWSHGGEPGPQRSTKHGSQLFIEVSDFDPRELISPRAPDSAGLN